MLQVSGCSIYDATTNDWLQEDENTWDTNYTTAAFFSDPELAEAIRVRETRTTDGIEHVTIVMGVME